MLERDILDRYGQLQRGDAPKQRVKDDLQLGTGQLLTDALVPAVAERDVLTSTDDGGIAARVRQRPCL